MQLPLYWIDAFTDRLFTGNPAAVVPLDAWLPDSILQNIAFENGLAETAFVVSLGPAHYQLRWFTPKLEVDLCGHATLATAAALFHELAAPGPLLTFETRSGPLLVTRRADGKLELDFPSRPAAPFDPADAPPALLAALGVSPLELWRTPDAPRFLAVFADATAIRAVTPDFTLLASLGDTRLIITAPGEECDFVSRFFAPGAGVPEDPVTGSAHCTLVPYWAARLGRQKLSARQLSARGGARDCELTGDRVRLAGHTRLYLRGHISL
jgi:PhzF family phenazine biosynthesis protein